MTQHVTLDVNDVLTQLEALAKAKKISVLDHQFAKFISQFEDDGLVVLAAALISYQSGQGHVCVYLDSSALSTLFGLNESDLQQHIRPLLSQLPNGINQWHTAMITALQNSDSQGENAPLTLQGNRLYLQRYWQNEQLISQFLMSRSRQISDKNIQEPLRALFKIDLAFCWLKLNELKSQQLSLATFCSDYFHVRDDIGIDNAALVQYLQNIDSIEELAQLAEQFTPQQCIDWQQVAVALACVNQFSIISGGPGTGKTTTVTKLLALLIDLSSNAEKSLTIELVAPTGKAAARLTESISGAIDKLNVSDEIKRVIPTHASTIHRLLGVIPNRVDFKHNHRNPLHVDVLIVDEASMIDISLMAKLLSAIAPHTKLILLGDKDQLSSVEAGAVFADICQGISQGPNYSDSAKQWVNEQTGFLMNDVCYSSHDKTVVDDGLCLLQKSYRFNEKSGIGALAKAVNHGDVNALKAVWSKGFSDISLTSDETNQQAIIQLSVMGYKNYLNSAKQISAKNNSNEQDIAALLKQFNQFQLLSPVREGSFGIDGLNEKIEQQLARHKFISLNQGTWYVGRPIMIVSNDHSQQLFNGDIGIVLPPLDDDSQLIQNRVYFKMADGSIKSFLPSRLPAHETVYAMTIHKSQGSEFDDVVIAIPPKWTPLLTRELVYTGITRAKKTVAIFSDVGILQKAALTQTQRFSGLALALKQA